MFFVDSKQSYIYSGLLFSRLVFGLVVWGDGILCFCVWRFWGVQEIVFCFGFGLVIQGDGSWRRISLGWVQAMGWRDGCGMNISIFCFKVKVIEFNGRKFFFCCVYQYLRCDVFNWRVGFQQKQIFVVFFGEGIGGQGREGDSYFIECFLYFGVFGIVYNFLFLKSKINFIFFCVIKEEFEKCYLVVRIEFLR